MNIARSIATALLALAALTGCSSTPAAPGVSASTYNQLTGNLTTTLDATLDRAWASAKSTVEELQFRPGTSTKDALTGILTAKTADNTEVKIRLEQRTQSTTDVTVGVGPFGKEATARLILGKIRSKV
jgi:hypothetical protein